MEYIEYYRIIKERVWLAILGAFLAGMAVLAMQLMTATHEYTAEGSVIVNRVAMATMTTQGDELAIGTEKELWQNLLQVGANPTALTAILRELKYAPDAEDQYKVAIHARQIKGSRYAVFSCLSSDKELSLSVVNTGMDMWDRNWRSIKIQEANYVIDLLKARLPIIETQLEEIQGQAEAIETAHGGLAPSKEAQTIESSLAATQLAMQNANLETAAAGERSKALAGQPQRTMPAEANQGLAFVERIDDLKQQIMDREVMLADMLERRTKEHPSVKALERQIADMKKRVGALEEAAAAAENNSSYVQESVIAARTYAQEMAARSELLATREGELRNRLSEARTDIIKYEQIMANAVALQNRVSQIQESLRSAEAELLARREAKHMLTVEAKAKVPREAGLLKQTVIRLGLAIFGGAGLGILVIFVLHYIDTSFKNEEEAARLLGYPVLGGIPHSDVEVIEEEVSESPPDGDSEAQTP